MIKEIGTIILLTKCGIKIAIAKNNSKAIIKRETKGAKPSEKPIGINCPCSNTFVIPYIGVGYNLAKAESKKSAEIKILKNQITLSFLLFILIKFY